MRVDDYDAQFHVPGNNRRSRRAPHAQRRRAQLPEDQHPVQEEVCGDGADAGHHGHHGFPALPQRAGVSLHDGERRDPPEHNPQIGIALPQRQRQVAPVAFPLQEAADECFPESQVNPDAENRADQAEDHFQPEGVPHAVHVALAVKLRAVDADPAESAEDGQHEHHQHRVGDRCRGDGFRAQAAHHDVVQQRYEIGDKLLYDNGDQQRQHGVVKGACSDQAFQHGSNLRK